MRDLTLEPKMSFIEACQKYIDRYTMEHVPKGVTEPAPNGLYYAPHYATDREWYNATVFPPHNVLHRSDCHSTKQTWPLGYWLDRPYQIGMTINAPPKPQPQGIHGIRLVPVTARGLLTRPLPFWVQESRGYRRIVDVLNIAGRIRLMDDQRKLVAQYHPGSELFIIENDPNTQDKG